MRSDNKIVNTDRLQSAGHTDKYIDFSFLKSFYKLKSRLCVLKIVYHVLWFEVFQITCQAFDEVESFVDYVIDTVKYGVWIHEKLKHEAIKLLLKKSFSGYHLDAGLKIFCTFSSLDKTNFCGDNTNKSVRVLRYTFSMRNSFEIPHLLWCCCSQLNIYWTDINNNTHRL